MFDFDPNTIYVAKVLFIYAFGVVSALASVVYAIILYDLRYNEGEFMTNFMDVDADLEHIDIALNDNLYTTP
jgi:hypothetical protein